MSPHRSSDQMQPVWRRPMPLLAPDAVRGLAKRCFLGSAAWAACHRGASTVSTWASGQRTSCPHASHAHRGRPKVASTSDLSSFVAGDTEPGANAEASFSSPVLATSSWVQRARQSGEARGCAHASVCVVLSDASMRMPHATVCSYACTDVHTLTGT